MSVRFGMDVSRAAPPAGALPRDACARLDVSRVRYTRRGGEGKEAARPHWNVVRRCGVSGSHHHGKGFMSDVRVWDLPTRAFHWLFAACIFAAYFTGEAESGTALRLHYAAGYGAGLLVIFRVVWGFLGTRHARFAEFWPSVEGLSRYISGLKRLKPPRMLGHNPLGAVNIFLMLGLAAAAVWTGVGLGGGEAGEETHELLANLLMILVVVHIAAVALDSVLTGENLTRAMITGTKRAPEEGEVPAAGRAPMRLAGALALTAVVSVALASTSRFLDWPPPAYGEAEAGHGEDEGRAERE
jgi:cytochrome b